MKLITKFLISLLTISMLSGCTEPSKYYERASTEMGNGDFSSALADYDKAIKLKPDYIEAYIGRGGAKFKLGDLNGALADYNKAAELKPELVSAPDLAETPETIVTNDIATQAVALIQAKDYEKLDALAAKYRSSKECYPDGVWKLSCIYDGVVLSNHASDNDWDARLDAIGHWTVARPNSITARVAWANVLVAYAWKARGAYETDTVTPEGWKLFFNRLTQADKILKGAKSLKEQCPLFWRVAMRDALGLQVRRTQFDAIFDEAIKTEPSFVSYYFRRVIYLLPQWQGTKGEWQSDLIKSVDKIGGENGDMLYAQVIWNLNESGYVENPFIETNVSLSRVDKGFEVIEKKLPDSLAAKIGRIQIAILSKDAEAFRYCYSGYAKQTKKEWDAAISDYNKAIELKVDFAEAYSHRGFSKKGKGDLKGAMSDYDKALVINPKSSGTYFNRAMTKRALSDNEGAMTDLNKAIELNTNYAEAYAQRGMLKQHKSDQQGAMADFARANKLLLRQ